LLIAPFLDLGMASRTRALPVHTPVYGPTSPSRSKINGMPQRNSAKVLDREIPPIYKTDLVLYHNAADAIWAKELAERIRGERFGNRQLVTEHANWNLSSASDILAEAEKCLHTSRNFGLVVSKRMLQEDWPSLEKLISALSKLDLDEGRFITLLKENVTMPPLLRLQEWIDFRDDRRREESVHDFLGLLRKDFSSLERSSRSYDGMQSQAVPEPAWKTRPLFLGAQKGRERIVSNLFPAVEIPKEVFSVESRFHNDAEITEACGGPGPLPFLLKGSRLYTASPITENSVFKAAVKEGSKPSQERFVQWHSDPARAPWAIELLNHLLRYHAWKRGMRFDEGQRLFYFTRSKPKKIWWEIGGNAIQREVTAPHMKWNQIDGQVMAEFQCGWKHEAIRAEFIQVFDSFFLRLEPAWFMTELDGKTPSTNRPVGPLESFPPDQQRNGQILRTLRFWSAVLAKGHRELRIETGANPIRVRLTPASGSSPAVLTSDQLDFDTLVLADIGNAQLIPELAPIEH
jgi:hypothetical protein